MRSGSLMQLKDEVVYILSARTCCTSSFA
eukprot:COSAG06_NODE_57804_length_279_cov_0.577778_1_plen_28_part_10